MASLETRAGNYRIVFRVGGRKFSRTLKTVSEKEARGFLARLEDNLRRVELGTLILPENIDTPTYLLSDGHLDQRPKCGPNLTLKEIFGKFLASIPEASLERSTISSLETHERHLVKHLGARFPIRTLTLEHLQEYVDRRSHDKGRRGRKVTPFTVRRAVMTLQTVWNWGVQRDLVSGRFPNRGLRYAKMTEKASFQTFAEVERLARGVSDAEAADLWDCVFLTVDEIEELLNHVKENASQPFLYPMFVFAAHTGARRSEIMRSNLADLDFAGNSVIIHERKRVRGKLTMRRVPMSPFLKAALEDWLAIHPGGRRTFCNHVSSGLGTIDRQVRPLKSSALNNHFKRTLARGKWKNLRGWHVFRHSFCSNCAAAGVDQRIINGWVGHQTEEMVRRYRHLIPDQQQSAIMTVFGDGQQALVSHAGCSPQPGSSTKACSLQNPTQRRHSMNQSPSRLHLKLELVLRLGADPPFLSTLGNPGFPRLGFRPGGFLPRLVLVGSLAQTFEPGGRNVAAELPIPFARGHSPRILFLLFWQRLLPCLLRNQAILELSVVQAAAFAWAATGSSSAAEPSLLAAGARYSLTASDIRRNSPYILTARFPKATASAVFFAVAARIDQLPAQ
jgi:integrase